jgi:hypothetical protein
MIKGVFWGTDLCQGLSGMAEHPILAEIKKRSKIRLRVLRQCIGVDSNLSVIMFYKGC